MSDATFAWLPPKLQPRREDDGGGPARRAIELAVLLILAVLLASATIYDLSKQVGVDVRIGHDKTTWLAYTHHPVHKLTIIPGVGSSRDVVCGPPFTGADFRQCIVLTGATHGNGTRTVIGGYRLPLTGNDLYRHRWGCFGEPATRGFCISAARPLGW
jgi:hypothetical protein